MTHWKGINYPFLIFLVLLTQGNILIKPLAFILIIFVWPFVPTKIDRNSMGVFYFLMVVYASFSIFTLYGNADNSYLLVYLLASPIELEETLLVEAMYQSDGLIG